MSNLGLYQTMTTLSKKVGGPINLALIIAGAGYGICRTVEAGVKRVVKTIKSHSSNNCPSTIYHILADGISNEGLTFSVGDTFQVLEKDEDAVLIAKTGDVDNPHFVSARLLQAISDYKE